MEHPEHDMLLAYSKGQLPAEADEKVALHLEECSGECLKFLDGQLGNVQAALDAVLRRAARRYGCG